MKKLIAILLVCVFVLSVAACGKKNDPENTLPVSGGNTETHSTEASATAAATETPDTTEATASSVVPENDATQPSEGNKIEPVKPDQGKPDTDEDDDIKIEIGGDEDISITPPDEDTNSNFVIDFDDLIAAGN